MFTEAVLRLGAGCQEEAKETRIWLDPCTQVGGVVFHLCLVHDFLMCNSAEMFFT